MVDAIRFPIQEWDGRCSIIRAPSFGKYLQTARWENDVPGIGLGEFDSTRPHKLMCILRRFGIPEVFTQVVDGIYSNREFYGSNAGSNYSWRPQVIGIVQGCPLSQFFSIAMTCLLFDADQHIVHKYGNFSVPSLSSRSLLYADDTLIMEADAQIAQAFMETISKYDAAYGLKLNDRNWKRCV